MGRKKKNNQCISNWSSMQLMNCATESYDVMDSVIENIYKDCVKLDEEETKALNERFDMVIGNFVEKMKEVDITFKEIFNRIYYTGSYYDGLRISAATEFDLNLVLKPKINMEHIRKRRPPGFTSIQVYSRFMEAPYKDWVNQRGGQYYLNPDSVRWWFQGVVTETLKIIEKEKEEEKGKWFSCCKLKIHESGPAWTLSVTFEDCKPIDIDLVPVLEFNTSRRGITSLKKKDIRLTGLDEPWFAVPKPPKCPHCYQISWRMSFPIQETAIIKDLNFFKYTIKMIKKVRDALGIHEVASYHIKNLFLLELQKHGPDMWAQSRRGFLFMHMLECFRKAVASGKIPFLWNENCNLIGNVPKATLVNRAGRLQNVCDQINRLIENKNDLAQQKQNHEQLRILMESLLNPKQDEKKPSGQEKLKGSDSETTDSESDDEMYNISHSKGLKAVETLMKYINQQGGATKDDINFLQKWEKVTKLSKNK